MPHVFSRQLKLYPSGTAHSEVATDEAE
mgnify:CR=1